MAAMTFLKKNILYIALLVALVFRFRIPSFRTGYEVLFLCFATTVFSYHLNRKGHFEAAVFLLICMISSLYPLATVRSFQALRVVFISVGLYYLICSINFEVERVMNVLVAGCLVHILFLVLKHYNIEPYMIYGMKTMSGGIGLTANPNEASAMLTLCAPAFFRPKFIYLTPLLVVGYAIAGSFAGYLAIGMFLCIFLIKKRLWWALAVVAGAVVYGYFYKRPFPGDHRLIIWSDTIKAYFKERMVWGYGLGHFEYISKNLLIGDGTRELTVHRAHNTFLQAWFEIGFPVVPVIAAFIWRKIKGVVASQHVYAIAGMLLVCSVNSAFRINAINALIMIVWLSMIKVIEE
jgi:hypothetical protein